jgi:ribonuclease P protein component
LFREILRLTPVEPGWDIIFIARPAAATTEYAELRKSVESLLSQAQLLVENYEGIRLKTN